MEKVRTELKSAVIQKQRDPRLTGHVDALEKSISGAVAVIGQAAVGEKLDAGVAALTGR